MPSTENKHGHRAGVQEWYAIKKHQGRMICGDAQLRDKTIWGKQNGHESSQVGHTRWARKSRESISPQAIGQGDLQQVLQRVLNTRSVFRGHPLTRVLLMDR